MKYALMKEKIKNMKIYYKHPPYSLEKKLLDAIKIGLLDEAILTLDIINSTERATLSKDSLRSIKNSLIISCALFGRAVINANVNPEDVFTLSDLFIIHIDSLTQINELYQFEYEMLAEFIKLTNDAKVSNYSQPINSIIKYIHANISTPLTVNELAANISKSPDYLSKLFKNEVGITITTYILIHKIQLAQYFLEFTSMKVIDISVLLSFCNQAYFSSTFKKYTGSTPTEYRLHNTASILQ